MYLIGVESLLLSCHYFLLLRLITSSTWPLISTFVLLLLFSSVPCLFLLNIYPLLMIYFLSHLVKLDTTNAYRAFSVPDTFLNFGDKIME